jgi:hypothetical protein
VLTSGFLGLMVDGMDLMFLSYSLPSLMRDFHIDKVQAGSLASVTLLGMAVGGLVGGWAADRFGRVRVVVWTILLFSCATGLLALTQAYWQFALLRFVSALGLGAEYVVSNTLMAEYVPTRHRTTVLGTLQAGWSVGYVVAAVPPVRQLRRGQLGADLHRERAQIRLHENDGVSRRFVFGDDRRQDHRRVHGGSIRPSVDLRVRRVGHGALSAHHRRVQFAGEHRRAAHGRFSPRHSVRRERDVHDGEFRDEHPRDGRGWGVQPRTRWRGDRAGADRRDQPRAVTANLDGGSPLRAVAPLK